MNAATLDWAKALPKVELHLHLEGAIPIATLAELVSKYAGARTDPRAVARRFAYRDFAHFIDTWLWMTDHLREEEDFELAAEAVARYLVEENVRYAEVFFSPLDFRRHGLTTQQLAHALRRGLERVSGVDVALICDLVRDGGPERAERTLAEAYEARDAGIVGIGLGGSEAEYPALLFAQVFRDAAELGFHRTAHAGEAAGSDSVWDAVRLGVERIGHGVRAVEDHRLVAHLARQQIALEVCPTSNVRTGVVAQLTRHPIRELIGAGLVVTVNSDDPTFFGTTISREYAILAEKLGLGRSELIELAQNAIRASWAPARRKRTLNENLRLSLGGGTRSFADTVRLPPRPSLRHSGR